MILTATIVVARTLVTSRRALSTDFEYLRRSLEEGFDLTSRAAGTS
jgi:hypothetical protein